MRRAVVCGLALGFAAPAAHAQAALLGPGAAFISIGVSQISNGELDDRLAAHGYPTFGRQATNIGIGGYRILSSGVMVVAELNGLMLGEKSYATGDVGFGGGHATLGVGYMFKLSRSARVYPRIGLGAGGFGVWFDKPADSVRFDDVLDNPVSTVTTHEPSMSRDGMVIDLGAGGELGRMRRGAGPIVGLRVGYLVAPFSSRWVSYDQKVSGGPDSNISGAYVRVVIGGAWRR
jgi:hypothetical protein